MINQPEKMTENCISLINAGLVKTAGRYCRFLNKGQARLFEKMQYPEKPFRARAQTCKKTPPTFEIISRIQTEATMVEPLHCPCYQNESWMLISAFSENFYSSNKGWHFFSHVWLRYLLAKCESGKAIGFSHFRFDLDEGDEVLYW